jgi:hypothetical protein
VIRGSSWRNSTVRDFSSLRAPRVSILPDLGFGWPGA